MTTSQNTKAIQSSDAPDDLDADSMAAIRNMMSAEPVASPKPAPERTSGRAALVDIAPVQPEGIDKPIKAKRFRRAKSKGGSAAPSANNDLKSRILGFRPTKKQIVLGALVLFALLRPWLAIGLIVLSVVATIALFLALGHDRFWKRVIDLARAYARRNPARAADLHLKLDRFASGWDAFLDRFPEGTVDGLYLPDFGELAQADARHEATLERRFKDLREGEA